MKKNRMMRIATALLIAVLLTTCAISGTFAKYVTTASGTDSARVAKWGVDIEIVSGAGFSNEYATDDTNYSGALSVKSADNKNVVAPGTSSEDVNGNVTFTISGAPEVAVKVDIAFDAKSEIKLAAGDYLDYTTANSDTDTFTLNEEYYPVKFTLTKTGEANPVVNKGTLADVEEALNGDTAYYEPNADLDVTYTLTWEWAFSVNDKADTYLGNEATLQTLAYDLTISVTQVD
ncbi:MAG: hypothetical protein E7615_02205 [Ruminococcaceae bacterium]|nr:hypothetical protein [Oscillospiraceae bacterium]